jgi:hypothetical protein
MPDLSGLSDAELRERYARCDLHVRQMSTWSREMDAWEKLMCEIIEEQAKRKEANGNG